MPSKNGLVYEFFEGSKRKDINVVFIHGTGCNKKFLQGTKDALSDYNIYYFDLPGHGESADTGYSAENYINSAVEFVKDIKNVILIGHSLGGTLTVGTLARKPPTVIGGVVASGALNFKGLDKEFLNKIHQGVINKDLVLAGFGHLDNDEVKTAISVMEPDEVTLKDWNIDEFIDVTEGANEINVPVEVFVGDSDPLTTVQDAKNIVNTIPTAELTIFENARHMAVVALKHDVAKLIDKIVKRNNL